MQSRTHSWTDFNLPDTLSYQGKSVAFSYDASYKRVKEITTDGGTVRTLYLIHPDNAGGLGFEREETRVNGVLTRNESRHYISAGGWGDCGCQDAGRGGGGVKRSVADELLAQGCAGFDRCGDEREQQRHGDRAHGVRCVGAKAAASGAR